MALEDINIDDLDKFKDKLDPAETEFCAVLKDADKNNNKKIDATEDIVEEKQKQILDKQDIKNKLTTRDSFVNSVEGKLNMLKLKESTEYMENIIKPDFEYKSELETETTLDSYSKIKWKNAEIYYNKKKKEYYIKNPPNTNTHISLEKDMSYDKFCAMCFTDENSSSSANEHFNQKNNPMKSELFLFRYKRSSLSLRIKQIGEFSKKGRMVADNLLPILTDPKFIKHYIFLKKMSNAGKLIDNDKRIYNEITKQLRAYYDMKKPILNLTKEKAIDTDNSSLDNDYNPLYEKYINLNAEWKELSKKLKSTKNKKERGIIIKEQKLKYKELVNKRLELKSFLKEQYEKLPNQSLGFYKKLIELQNYKDDYGNNVYVIISTDPNEETAVKKMVEYIKEQNDKNRKYEKHKEEDWAKTQVIKENIKKVRKLLSS